MGESPESIRLEKLYEPETGKGKMNKKYPVNPVNPVQL